MDENALRVILTALVKVGFVVMPKEPTPEMCMIMRRELYCNSGGELDPGAERDAYHAAVAHVLKECGIDHG